MIYYYTLDTETTGLKAGFHEINEISILRLKDEKQLSFQIAVDFPQRANEKALEIQGKTLDDLKDGEDKFAALKKIHDFILEDGSSPEHRCIVAHNASFDQRFCHREWDNVGLIFPAHLWLCTQKFSKLFVKEKKLEKSLAAAQGEQKVKYGLNPLIKGLGLPTKKGAHSAEADTVNCGTLFSHLMKSGVEHVSSIKRIPQINDSKKKTDNDMDDF